MAKKKVSRKKRRRRQQVILARTIVVLVLLAILGALGFLIFRLVGRIAQSAGPKEVSVTTVTVNKDGSIDETLVEDFDESLYDENGLMSMINEELSRYGKSVKFVDLETDSGKARLSLSFENDTALSNFNGTVFYADTIDSLKERGVVLPGDALMAGGDRAVVLSESMDVVLPRKVKYASSNVTVDGKKKSASATVADGTNAVIVY